MSDMRASIALAILLGSMTSAHAGNDVGVVVSGDSASQISTLVKDWLGGHGRVVVADAVPSPASTALADCVARANFDCARQVVDAKAKASAIVYVQAEVKRGTQALTMIVYWFEKGQPAGTSRRTCDGCSGAALTAAIDALMTELMRETPSATGHVKLRSSPSGAKITIDGQSVGVTPLDWDLAPGSHAVGMRRNNEEPRKRAIVVRAEATELVEMSLGELPPSPAREEHDDSFVDRTLPLAAMATGAAAVIAGAVMIAIDQNTDPRAPTSVHNSAPAGAAISIGGAVLAGVGAYLWFRRPAPTSSPMAAVSGDGAYVGWLGRF